jgi:hypothetical protein
MKEHIDGTTAETTPAAATAEYRTGADGSIARARKAQEIHHGDTKAWWALRRTTELGTKSTEATKGTEKKFGLAKVFAKEHESNAETPRRRGRREKHAGT